MSSPACGLCMQSFHVFQRARYTCPCCLDVVCRQCSRAPAGLKDVPRAERRTCLRCAPATLVTLVPKPQPPCDVAAFLSSGGLQLRPPTPRSPVVETDDLDFNWVHPYPKAPLPADETSRLATVAALVLPDHLELLRQDTTFGILLAKAMAKTECSMASLNLVDATHAITVAAAGFVSSSPRTPRLEALSSHVVVRGQILVVADTTQDMRFRAHPVATETHAAAVVSVPLLHNGCVIGTIDLLRLTPLAAPLAPKVHSELTALAKLAAGFIVTSCKPSTESRPRRKTAPAKIESECLLVETMEALLFQSMRTSNYVQDIAASR
ncbi:hypothetical protein ACHHYP_00203 [Achlya hypogyna]|uniref:GAF domain-containing protein n=1 Tax=Achlya hypogyna TaxID=1202772 RepID=A0A1V9ZB75_ACHHY|nr:hypothetical protein ACHHYP_00203 [Achlya hypogyna]